MAGLRRISINDATDDQLRDFGSIMLGIPIEGNEDAVQMISLIKKAGYNDKEIAIGEPAAMQAPTTGGSETTRMKDGRKQFCIRVETQDSVGGDRPVPVSVNGQTMLIPRGKPVWVYEEYVEVLANASQHVYASSDKGLQEPRIVQSYPFSVVPPLASDREAEVA